MDSQPPRPAPFQPPAGISPAALRNAAPILAVLQSLFVTPKSGDPLAAGSTVLEIAAGAGYHATVFARAMPQYRWQPTEADRDGCAAVAATVAAADLPNLEEPRVLDVTETPWSVNRADAMVCINMIHISPWPATLALFAGAARCLPVGGLLVTYGPYLLSGDFQADSNRAFDQSLRARNPLWGIRDVNDIVPVATANGFAHALTQPMPANNHMLAFRKL